jgi:hypothetical protein
LDLFVFFAIGSSEVPVGCPRRESKTNSQSRSSSEGRTSSQICTQTPDPRFSVGLQNRAPMSARAVAVIRSAPTIIALLAFLCILSGQRQLHAFEDLLRSIAG